jgi:hypothetical protein
VFGSLSWSFLHVIASFELSQTSLTHSLAWLCILSELRVIQSVFAWVIASNGTWGSIWCGFLVPLSVCWCLDGLEQRRSVGKSWWLFLATSWWLVRGLVPSLAVRRKVTLVDCLCHWVTSLVGRFLRCPIMWTRFVQHLLAAEPPSVGRHNRD